MNYEDLENKTGLLWCDKITGHLLTDIMQSIDIDTINWKQQSNLWTIDTFYAICPQCDSYKAIKTNSGSNYDNTCETSSQSAECTMCKQHFVVFAINPLVGDNLKKLPFCESAWAYPAANNPRQMIFSENNNINVAVFRSYKSAIDSFNSKNWFAVLSSCGRALEGICKIHFPNPKNGDTLGKLFANLEKSLISNPQYSELLNPMQKLGDALHLGRDIGAHLNFKKEPDKLVSENYLESTEFLMKYFYLVSGEAEVLRKQLLALEPLEEDTDLRTP